MELSAINENHPNLLHSFLNHFFYLILFIEGAIEQGWIKLHKTKIIKRLEEFGIDEGEAEAISLAIDLKCKDVLVDQSHARVAAKVFGLTPRGTIFVLLKALRKNIITFDDYLKDLGELIRVGFRMSDEVYVEAVKLGREIIKGK